VRHEEIRVFNIKNLLHLPARHGASWGPAYMNWARFPIAETEALESGERGYIVRLKDLRFDYAGRVHYFASAVVRLNHDLSVADVSFRDWEY
jgi:hypothetical protein